MTLRSLEKYGYDVLKDGLLRGIKSGKNHTTELSKNY